MKSTIISLSLIVALMLQLSAQQGLVGYYSFSGNANDSSTLAINGIVHGAVLTTGITNSANSAYRFTAANNDYIDFGANNRGITNKITASMWIKTTSTSQQLFFTKYDGPADAGYTMGILNGKAYIGGRDGNNAFRNSGYSQTLVNDGQWHHIAGVVDVNTWKIYVDGNKEAQYTHTSSSVNLANNDRMTIGRWFTGDPNGNHFTFNGDSLLVFLQKHHKDDGSPLVFPKQHHKGEDSLLVFPKQYHKGEDGLPVFLQKPHKGEDDLLVFLQKHGRGICSGNLAVTFFYHSP